MNVSAGSPWSKMMYHWAVHGLLIMVLIKGTVQGPQEERLINDIFTTRRYNRLARPVQEETDILVVRFGTTLQQIVEVDEKNEMIHTNMWLNYEWHDYNLEWNATEYGGVKSIRLPSKLIWTPDILMYNSADEDIDSKFPTNIIVYSSGLCSWIPLGLYISTCPIDIKYFPFDEQYCKMKFGSWTYDGTKINLTNREDQMDISTYSASGEWDLLDVPAKRNVFKYDCCEEDYIDITFTIHIRRRTLYYGFNLIIPCALISFLAVLSFTLPPDAGEKISLGITILLSLSVFSLIVADMVPATSLAVPLVGVYFAAIMMMCTLSVIMTVLVLNFHHRNPDMYEMPLWVRKLICEWLAWILRMNRPGRDLSRQFLLRKAKMRELEAKSPPSLSLISNVKDVDNAIPMNDFPPLRSVKIDDHHSYTNVRCELLAILNELRYITHKIKGDNEADDETNNWKFAAMVIDRLCFWLFMVYLLVTTLVIFFSAPNMFK